jgi:excisionase family DNA binding protein
VKPALDLPAYMPAIQAARELNLPYSTLRTAHFNGELPALKVGKEHSRRESWYFKRSDLLDWLERRTETKPKKVKPQIHAA